ncbi:P-loop NTPase fold protein [Nostoc sp. UIC 10607]|uniref:P-loop NTPase fold protein n=1 Tax=Nostoc sp. UIC 10607 TaxID=3045935 RepID=UPI0039A0848E
MYIGPILLSDAPVDSEGDLIWQETDIDLDAAMISDTILNSEDPLVFAIHGPWGSGKTSFLKIVESRLKKQENQTIYISWYIASTYQSVGDAATTLTLRILRTLRGETRDSSSSPAEDWYTQFMQQTFPKVRDEAMGMYGFLEELAAKVAVLSDLGVLIENILNGGAEGDKKKLVLMIDDLDRCSLEYIGDLIEATQRLSSVKNLFIFLAIDQARLTNALGKRFEDVKDERGPRWTGEKYIQHTIELPPLDENSLKDFIDKSLQFKHSNVENTELYPSALEALETISKSTSYFATAIRHKFPRTVKACINLIRPVLTREIIKSKRQHSVLDSDEKRRIVKRRLIEYLFREFSEICLKKAELNKDSQEFEFLLEAEGYCRDSYSKGKPSVDTYELLKFRLERLKRANLLESEHLIIPEELAKLLAQDPFFCLEEREPHVDNVIVVDAEQKFVELYNQSEEARKASDAKNCVIAATNAYRFAIKNRQALGNVAWRVHNLALNAEEFHKIPLAEALYRLALEIDPTYVRSMVYFSAFIIKNRFNLYDEAKQWLEIAYKSRNNDEFIPLILTSSLVLKERVGQTTTQEIEEINRRIEASTDAKEIGEYLRGMIDAKRDTEAIELFKKAAPKFAGTKSLASMQLNFASDLIMKGDHGRNISLIALELFKQLLDKQELLQQNQISTLKYYYAYELYVCGYIAQAVDPFFEAYNQMRNNPGSTYITSNFPEFLRDIGATHLIQKVILREAIEPSEWVFIEETEPLPEHFSPIALPNYL